MNLLYHSTNQKKRGAKRNRCIEKLELYILLKSVWMLLIEYKNEITGGIFMRKMKLYAIGCLMALCILCLSGCGNDHTAGTTEKTEKSRSSTEKEKTRNKTETTTETDQIKNSDQKTKSNMTNETDPNKENRKEQTETDTGALEEIGDGIIDGVKDVGEGIKDGIEDVGEGMKDSADDIKREWDKNETETFHVTEDGLQESTR